MRTRGHFTASAENNLIRIISLAFSSGNVTSNCSQHSLDLTCYERQSETVNGEVRVA